MQSLTRARKSLKQLGASMIEVLMAILVMAFGMLGVAALQLASIRANQLAAETSVATAQLYSILDTVRANADVAKIGGYNLQFSNDCPIPNGSTLALRDLGNWRLDVRRALGEQACGSVQCNGSNCTVSINWVETGGGGANRPAATVSSKI